MQARVATPVFDRVWVVNITSEALSSGACSKVGAMQYNFTNKVWEFCDGTQYNDMAVRGAGAGGCTGVTPVPKESAMLYDTAINKYKFCDGNGWVVIE